MAAGFLATSSRYRLQQETSAATAHHHHGRSPRPTPFSDDRPATSAIEQCSQKSHAVRRGGWQRCRVSKSVRGSSEVAGRRHAAPRRLRRLYPPARPPQRERYRESRLQNPPLHCRPDLAGSCRSWPVHLWIWQNQMEKEGETDRRQNENDSNDFESEKGNGWRIYNIFYIYMYCGRNTYIYNDGT